MMTRKLHCNDGHDLCHCAGRAECHNCGQPLSEDYEKAPLDHDNWAFDHDQCDDSCDLKNQS